MIETGRYGQIPRVNRLFHCPKYSIFRDRSLQETRVSPTIYKMIVYIGSYKRIFNEF